MEFIRRLYAPEFLVDAALVRGELPKTRQAYSSAFSIAGASIAESFLIALISMADTIMVGVVGYQAIAAVGLSTQPRYIVLTLIMSLNMAVTAITARRKGQNDQDGAVQCLKQALAISLGMALVLSVSAFLGRRELLLLAGAKSDTLGPASEYFAILMTGIPASAVSMTISAALRGIGETRASMKINMAANVVNLAFNFLLIGGRFGFPALGVRGAAIATVIGQCVGLLLALAAVAHRERFLFLFSRSGWKIDRKLLKSIYQVAGGAFLEQLCLRIGFLAYARIVAELNTMMFAAHNICMNILSLSFSIGEGFGVAASSLVGQNLGAKRPDLSIVYGKVCQRMSYIACTGMFFIFAFLGRSLMRLFTDEPAILEVGEPIMLIMGVIVFGQASQMILMGSLRGAGDTKYTAVVSMISVMLLRPALSYALTYPVGLGLVGAWLSLLGDQYLRLFLTAKRFSSGKWMSIEL